MRTRVTNPDVLRKRFEQSFKDSYYTKVRNAGGKVLKFAPDTMACWKKLLQAKTRPAFQRRAQEFLELVKRDSHANLTDKDWTKKLTYGDYMKHGFGISKSRGGASSTPLVKLEEHLAGIYGDYTLHLLAGKHEIRIESFRGIDEMRETFRHETLHYIDQMSAIPDDGHGHYWQIRLDKLSQILKLR